MEILLSVSIFILGTIIGSFLNVFILRYNTGASFQGRSKCFSCGTTLSWRELIPILSFVYLDGRCRHCRSSVSAQYPLVELATGFLFLGIFLEFPFTLTAGYILSSVFYALIGSLLIVIVAYDLRHTIIPNLCVYSFIALTFLWLFIDIETMTLVNPSIISILAGPLVAFPLFLLWLVSRGKWMGLGDAKIALGIGFMLGIYGGFSALMISFWAGALVSVIFLALQKKTALSRAGKQLTIKSEIPFAPFLVFGFFLVFFFNLNVFVLW